MRPIHCRHAVVGAISFLFALRPLLPRTSTTDAFVLTTAASAHRDPLSSTTRSHSGRQFQFLSQSTDTMEESKEKGAASKGSSSPVQTLKVLALHGSEGDADEFPSRLSALGDVLREQSSLQLDITAVQGPFSKGSGYSWWNMPPGVRSFNAKEYEGFEESATKVLDVWNNGTFDLVLGHSQGAILIASLLALGRAPYHPKQGYIFNGVSFPNPYSQEISERIADVDAKGLFPCVLFVMGRNDRITPNSSGEQLRDGLAKVGFHVDSCYHDSGHGLPQENDPETLSAMAEWIERQRSFQQALKDQASQFG